MAPALPGMSTRGPGRRSRSEEHTSELQSRLHLVCRLLLEKKKDTQDTEALRERELTPPTQPRPSLPIRIVTARRLNQNTLPLKLRPLTSTIIPLYQLHRIR